MDDIGVAEALAGPNICDIEFAWQLDSDLLPGHLPERGIVIDGDAVLPDDSCDGDVVFNDCQNLCVPEAIASNLRLCEPLAVSRQDFDGR